MTSADEDPAGSDRMAPLWFRRFFLSPLRLRAIRRSMFLRFRLESWTYEGRIYVHFAVRAEDGLLLNPNFAIFTKARPC